MKLILSTVAVFLCLGSVTSRPSDSFTLSEQWPPAACMNLNGQTPQGFCNRIPRTGNSWSLHGFWPNRQSQSVCDRRQKFKMSDLPRDLINELTRKWPSLKSSSSNEWFWSHEYDKHGVCAVDLPKMNTVEKYFRSSLELLDRYNVGVILQQGGIVPGKSYKLDVIKQQLRKTLRVGTEIHCSKKTTGRSRIKALFEVRLCFNINFNLINCPNSDQKFNCGAVVNYI